LRRAASACGADPLRTRQASSPSVTSRTPCSRFSIPQCPRDNSNSRSGPATAGARLVIP
jgi:hypothetical protein